ncbi:hypothetical protein ANOM_009020, partial [Aspergillus nomiae NRRL 13137]
PSEPTLTVRVAGDTNEDIPFHTDVGDIVSLFALGESAEGGESLLASSWRVYNELARTRPDIIQVLASDWPIPRFFQTGGCFHPPASDVPPEFIGNNTGETVDQFFKKMAEALDSLHFLAERFHISMKLQKGDMQFFNNLSILHARRGYNDGPQQKRHFLRLWLKDPENAWPMPKQLQQKWDGVYSEEESRGPQVFPLYPYTTV